MTRKCKTTGSVSENCVKLSLFPLVYKVFRCYHVSFHLWEFFCVKAECGFFYTPDVWSFSYILECPHPYYMKINASMTDSFSWLGNFTFYFYFFLMQSWKILAWEQLLQAVLNMSGSKTSKNVFKLKSCWIILNEENMLFLNLMSACK